MEKFPLISVIIPVFNGEKYIKDAVASIRRQNYAPFEIIIIDDGSTDASVAIIKTLDADVQLLEQANAGPAAARNRGLDTAQGAFISFLDADDLWPENKLTRQLTFLLANPEVEVVIGRSQFFGEFSARDKKLPLDEQQTAVGFNLGSGLFRRSAFERVGQFDEELRYSEDYDWSMRAREIGLRIHVMQETTLLHRIHQESLTHAENVMNYQLPLMLKKSLDRRRRSGNIGQLSSFIESPDE